MKKNTKNVLLKSIKKDADSLSTPKVMMDADISKEIIDQISKKEKIIENSETHEQQLEKTDFEIKEAKARLNQDIKIKYREMDLKEKKAKADIELEKYKAKTERINAQNETERLNQESIKIEADKKQKKLEFKLRVAGAILIGVGTLLKVGSCLFMYFNDTHLERIDGGVASHGISKTVKEVMNIK